MLIYDTFPDERASSIASLAILLDVSSVTSVSLTSSLETAGLSVCSLWFSFSPSDLKKTPKSYSCPFKLIFHLEKIDSYW